jgi:hypothetical protein
MKEVIHRRDAERRGGLAESVEYFSAPPFCVSAVKIDQAFSQFQIEPLSISFIPCIYKRRASIIE